MASPKQTLQLRHQLTCSGVKIQSATYDATRHHVLTYDSHALAPHTLRLFSLRREIKSIRLFDDDNPPPPAPLQARNANKDARVTAADAALVPVVHDLSLAYSTSLDIYVCAYTAQCVPLARTKSARALELALAVYNVLFLEPATLKKLLYYPGPASHRLRCVCFESASDRLVLAIEKKQTSSDTNASASLPSGIHHSQQQQQQQTSHASALLGHAPRPNDDDVADSDTADTGVRIVNAPMHHHVTMLQLSKRVFHDDAQVTNATSDNNVPQQRVMLCVEKAGPALLHSDAVDVLCAAPHLTRLFGVGGSRESHSSTSNTESYLLEWRESSEHRLELVRRVTFSDAVASLALSMDAAWLFTGHGSGAVRVWGVHCSIERPGFAKRTARYALGRRPLEADASTWHTTPVTSLQVASSSTRGDAAASMSCDVLLISADRDSGVVKHWQLCVSGVASDPLDLQERSLAAQLELVGSYNCDAESVTSPLHRTQSTAAAAATKKTRKSLLESLLTTIPVCVTIDAGVYIETLLLVLRSDVIHVLKVQTVMRVLQTFATGDDVAALRAVATASSGLGNRLVVLSGSVFSSIRVLECSDKDGLIGCQHGSRLSLPSPAAQRSARVSAIECFVGTARNRSFVTVGWSTGNIEIHALDAATTTTSSSRVATLQDPRLNAWITAVGATTLARQQQSPPAVFIFAGTEDGQLFGWRVSSLLSDSTPPLASSKLVLEATVCVTIAHSAHIVQLSWLDLDLDGSSSERRSAQLLTLGADGMLKVWDARSLTMVAYVNTATEQHMSTPSCLESIRMGDTGSNSSSAESTSGTVVAVGFDDGMLAAWRLDERTHAFTELHVTTHHERRITRIARIPHHAYVGTAAAFASCSLDMTVILWTIGTSDEDDAVTEQRYFDIGAPVISLCVIDHRVVVALPNELCAFAYAPRQSRDRQANVLEREKDAIEDDNSVDRMLRPDTPTTHSDSETFAHASDEAERMVRPLRPSSTNGNTGDTLSKFPITVPSVLSPSASTLTVAAGGAPSTVAILQPLESASSRKQPLAAARTVAAMTGDDLCVLLQQYVDTRGSSGTIAAESLVDFLTTERLTLVKRADFAIRRHLQAHRIDAKTRLSVLDACEVLLAIQQAHAVYRKRERIDQARAGDTARVQQQQARVRARKLREQRQATRKAVVTFNILGEKSIRWETVAEDAATESAVAAEGPAADASGDDGSIENVPVDHQRPVSPSFCVPTTDHVELPSTVAAMPLYGAIDNAATQPPATACCSKDDSRVQQQQQQRVHPRTKQSKKRSVGATMRSNTRTEEALDRGLIERLTLAHSFQPLWSHGFCWCDSLVKLHVITTTASDADDDAASLQCSRCSKKRHTLVVARCDSSTPHFSLRAMLDAIAEVYDELLAPSHALLFTTASSSLPQSSLLTTGLGAVSIHAALHRAFTRRFGMQTVVEHKIKSFMLSATHYVRDVDAIAVFGELLGMFAPSDNSNKDASERVPDEMVALAVCCYAWFFSRAMVVNGDAIAGTLHSDSRAHAIGSRLDGTSKAIERGRRTHWQYVQLSNALLCAHEMLLYPLVSPAYLRNIVAFAGDYAQSQASHPSDSDVDNDSSSTTQWIELHRFLRLLVGEYRQQQRAFRAAECTLFALPLLEVTDASTDNRVAVLEKLRLILSCFVFYDHSREGVLALRDFTNILRKLRYLWPNEHVTADDAEDATEQVSLTFENTILAAKRRFADVDGDGQLCYLDFWAMLYIVGVRTLSLLKFREIPSFCRDYKLDIALDLQALLRCYMESSSTMLLPRGVQLGKSSLDQRAHVQHQRRVAGLHDGAFRMPRLLGSSLSLQELLRAHPAGRIDRNDPTDQIYIDGSAPALSQSASVSAMDRFRPVTRNASDSNWHATPFAKGPVVVGVRPVGPREKPRAFLAMSALTNDALPDTIASVASASHPHSLLQQQQHDASAAARTMPLTSSASSDAAFASIHIQFPFVAPQSKRVDMATKPSGAHRIVGRLADSDVANDSWQEQILRDHERDERARLDAAAAAAAELQAKAAAQARASSMLVTSPLKLARSDLARRRKSTKAAIRLVESDVVQTSTLPANTVTVADVASTKKVIKQNSNNAVVVISMADHGVGTLAVAASVPAIVPVETPSHEADGDQSLFANDEQTNDDSNAGDALMDALTPAVSPAPSMESDSNPPPTAAPALDDDDDASQEASDDDDGDDNESDIEEEERSSCDPLLSETTVVESTTVVVDPVDNTGELGPVQAADREQTLDLLVPSLPPPPTSANDLLEVLIPATNTIDVAEQTRDTMQQLTRADSIPIVDTVTTKQLEVLPSTPAIVVDPIPHYDERLEAEIQPLGVTTHHSFRFSQQPAFRATIPVFSNPFRSQQWHPDDDSESDDENKHSDDDGVNSVELQMTPEALLAYRAAFGRRFRHRDPNGNINRPALRHIGLAVHAASQLGRVSSKRTVPASRSQRQASVRDTNSSSTVAINEHDASLSSAAAAASDSNIVLSADAEAQMQHKWLAFFDTAEAALFSPLKQELCDRDDAQRLHEEHQSRLMKKRQDEQAQDLLRLQQSRRESTIPHAVDIVRDDNDSATNFRMRRMMRESCHELQHELHFGASVDCSLASVNDAQYFFFEYVPSDHGSILTLRLHSRSGDTEVFLSTETRAPCASDFMWRSVTTKRTSATADDGDSHKLVLFPHDLTNVVATANAARTDADGVGEHDKLVIRFYLAVVAVEPNAVFALAVMASGQKMAPSRAIQVVDTLIGQFNQLSRSFEHHTDLPLPSHASVSQFTTTSFGSMSVNQRAAATHHTDSGFVGRIQAQRRAASRAQDDAAQADADNNDDNSTHSNDDDDGDGIADDATDDSGDRHSFQHLLESIAEKRGCGAPRTKSFFLSGPTTDQFEFVQDEVANLQDTELAYSPERRRSSVAVWQQDDDGEAIEASKRDALAAVAEGRLSLRSTLVLNSVRARAGSKLIKPRLASLHTATSDARSSGIAAKAMTSSSSAAVLRAAKLAPKPVAYSLSALDRSAHPHAAKSSSMTVTLPQVRSATSLR